MNIYLFLGYYKKNFLKLGDNIFGNKVYNFSKKQIYVLLFFFLIRSFEDELREMNIVIFLIVVEESLFASRFLEIFFYLWLMFIIRYLRKKNSIMVIWYDKVE